MLGWRWRGFCNTYSMTMLHFVPFTAIHRSSASLGATSINFDSSSASKTSPLTVLVNSSDSTGSGHIFRMIGRSNLSSRFALMRLATGQPPSTRDAGTARVVTVPLNSRDVLGSDCSVTVAFPGAALRDVSPLCV